MIRDLLRYFECGVSGVTKNSRALFDYSISMLKTLQNKQELAGATIFTVYEQKIGQKVHGKQYDDICSCLRLLKQMAEYSRPFAKFVVPFHYAQASEILAGLKAIKNTKL